MLAIKISHILNARGIDHHFTFLVNSGFNRHTAHNLLNSKTRSLRLDHIEFLCRILVCEPSDLIAYYPESKYPLLANHPLNSLIKKEDQGNTIKDSLRYLPYMELKEISNTITEQINHKKEAPNNQSEPT